jgi:hypothetical protein
VGFSLGYHLSMMMIRLLVACAILSLCSTSFAATKAVTKSPPAPTKTPAPSPKPTVVEAKEKEEEVLVRAKRPFSVSASFLGPTPLFGAMIDMNLHPRIGIGTGLGMFTLGVVTASFIPVVAHVYLLESNFTPYIFGGADFITVKFKSANVLLDSNFQGTQLIVGAGLEYRFDFGLLLRVNATRYFGAHITAPGLAIGYSVVVF